MVKNCSRPEVVHQLQSFLDLCIYYRKFIKCLSCIAKLLHKLTEAKKKFLWVEECENAFKKLKEALILLLVLAWCQLVRQYILDTDAKNESVRAVQSQEIEDLEHVSTVINIYPDQSKTIV